MNNEVFEGGLAAEQAPVLSMMMMMAVVKEDTGIGIGIILTSMIATDRHILSQSIKTG